MIQSKMSVARRSLSAAAAFLAVAIVLCRVQPVLGQALAIGAPAKFLTSCEIDLNGDKQADLVLSVVTVRGLEVIALMASGETYKGFVLSKNHPPEMRLSCEFGESVKETSAGSSNRRPRIVRTPGAYVELSLPEGSSFAYVWTGTGFVQIATRN